ncbi:MAG: biosynthetic arginine decarboxylase [Deltaproteobacteria bacterium]|nr:biosynthetic arginine decarboxylase [Deltaproteobacteria bacterium]
MNEKELALIQNGKLNRWTVENSKEAYGIPNWGKGFFTVSDRGEVVATPIRGREHQSISLMDIISGVKERGLEMPVLLRIENMLDSQLSILNESFNDAIRQFNYRGQYRGVYPIKVNQQQQVIEEITRFGASYHHGLEAGSKAELIIAISMIRDPEACIICNGYKDEKFIDLALYAIKLGFKCFIVVEMPCELELVLRRGRKLGITPRLGVRLKISHKAGGHWAESGGDRSLFGLNTTEIIALVDMLKQEGMLECLQLLHYHLGSQIPNIRDIRAGVAEACRYYTELVLEGAPMGYLDLGGGLAVDYDGSQTNFRCSRNYSVNEYCADIIEIVMANLDEKELPHPTIITESGRATVAHYSVLLFNILDVSRFDALSIPEKLPEGSHEMMRNLLDVYTSVNTKNIQEYYNDALYYKDEVQRLFRHGEISLRERSQCETIFWNIISKIAREVKKIKQVPVELEGIDIALADIYYCNFSIFQSLPDSWAIDQLFPIMPVHRLNECPTRRAILADITCDSDGKIDRFIDLHDVRSTLPLHEVKPGEEYFMGVFLVGAYQETLGDLHNLLGDTNIVSVRMNEDGSFDFVRELEGDSIADVLTYVEYDTKVLLTQFRQAAENAVREGKITGAERHKIMHAYESGLRGYTYYEK